MVLSEYLPLLVITVPLCSYLCGILLYMETIVSEEYIKPRN